MAAIPNAFLSHTGGMMGHFQQRLCETSLSETAHDLRRASEEHLQHAAKENLDDDSSNSQNEGAESATPPVAKFYGYGRPLPKAKAETLNAADSTHCGSACACCPQRV